MSRPHTTCSTSRTTKSSAKHVRAEGGLAEHWWRGKARAHQDCVARESKGAPRIRSLVSRAGGEDKVRQIMDLVEQQMSTVTLSVKQGTGQIKVNAPTRAEIREAKALFAKYLDDPSGSSTCRSTAKSSCSSRIGTARIDRESCVWAPGSLTGQQSADLFKAKQQRQASATDPLGTSDMGKTQARFYSSIPGYTGFKPINAMARGPIRQGPSSQYSQASLDFSDPAYLPENGNVLNHGAPRTKFSDYRKDCHIMLGCGSPFIKQGTPPICLQGPHMALATGFRGGKVGNGAPNEYGF